ncbi:Uroporphyrinogen-III synthase [Fodinibius salinus]|uniref:Uroporphyrinogen-III synthase n=1 Tax=Fodinibius salinus TaxID=860790 RepID=A0A5D3YKS1_9BACT|nr:uroporphyrinogen-III synthase [Fodinibius salinus]TYP93291.1 Uroporphyrinogen-III synthase [Fodinibius salinus]
MSKSILLTAAIEDTEQFRNALEEQQVDLLYCPLETYELLKEDQQVQDTLQQLDEFENIVHGSKRNAKFFVQKLKQYDKIEAARNQLNLAVDQHTADFLEEAGIPAVHPHSDGEAIDLMEFMLRIKRLGDTLYPCGDETAEDLPGFLQELDMPVEELVLFTLEGPGEPKLQEYQKEIAAQQVEIIVFHSRRSVNRTLAAFPNLNFEDAHIISAAQAVTDKLQNEDISPDVQADGSWKGILEEIGALL